MYRAPGSARFSTEPQGGGGLAGRWTGEAPTGGVHSPPRVMQVCRRRAALWKEQLAVLGGLTDRFREEDVISLKLDAACGVSVPTTVLSHGRVTAAGQLFPSPGVMSDRVSSLPPHKSVRKLVF